GNPRLCMIDLSGFTRGLRTGSRMKCPWHPAQPPLPRPVDSLAGLRDAVLPPRIPSKWHVSGRGRVKQTYRAIVKGPDSAGRLEWRQRITLTYNVFHFAV